MDVGCPATPCRSAPPLSCQAAHLLLHGLNALGAVTFHPMSKAQPHSLVCKPRCCLTVSSPVQNLLHMRSPALVPCYSLSYNVREGRGAGQYPRCYSWHADVVGAPMRMGSLAWANNSQEAGEARTAPLSSGKGLWESSMEAGARPPSPGPVTAMPGSGGSKRLVGLPCLSCC